MTTPGGQPLVTDLSGITPVAIIQRSSTPVPYLITNQDLQNNVYLSTTNALVPGGTNVFVIPGLGSIAVESNEQWWACTDPEVTTAINVLPGGTSWSPAPAQIAAVIAPLAAAIAQQIFATGIPVVSGPEVIYNL